MKVVDANIVYRAGTSRHGLGRLARLGLVGPSLLWPEVRSILHVAKWRGVISSEIANRGLELLHSGVVVERRHKKLGARAWEIADHFGWAKTYDAEYLALASLIDAPVLTLDLKMRTAAVELGISLAPVSP